MTCDDSKNRKRRMLVTGILASFVYGVWAYYVNYNVPTGVASTVAQIICSFVGGYYIAGLVEFTFSITKKPWRFPVAAFLPYLLFLIALATVHVGVGTPEVLKTITPNIIIGTPYFIFYCLKLERSEKVEPAMD